MKKNLKLIFNPFTRIAGWQGVAAGLVVLLLLAWIGPFSNTVFPGVLSAKLAVGLTFGDCLGALVIGVGVTAIVMYVAGIMLERGTRFQDVLATVTISKFPYIFSALSGFMADNEKLEAMAPLFREQAAAGQMPDVSLLAPLFGTMMVMIVMAVWSVTLLYYGFKVSTGSKGPKAGWTLTAVIFISEMIALIITYYALK